jgi:hypothetical protein
MLGNRPAVHPRQPRQQPADERRHPAPRLNPGKPDPDPQHQLIEFPPPALQVYAEGNGHRTIFCWLHTFGSSGGGRTTSTSHHAAPSRTGAGVLIVNGIASPECQIPDLQCQDGGDHPNPAEFAVAAERAASARAASIVSAHTASQIVSIVTVWPQISPRPLPSPWPSYPMRLDVRLRHPIR